MSTGMQRQKVAFGYAGQPDSPRVCRISSVDVLPSTRFSLVPRMYLYVLVMRTFHYHLHLIYQAADDIKSLRSC